MSTLKPHELAVLRAAVGRVYMAHHPNHRYTLAEADRIIESIGPQVAEKLLARAIEAKIEGFERNDTTDPRTRWRKR